ncbi:MAG TPA: hypothetical protein VEU08_16630 [Vicinamibacterales bacterium]|nr:hypothetical protein [Vicinamibacterales bacterium]
MEPMTSQEEARVSDGQPVHVDGTSVRIDELTIDRQTIVDYLRSIHPSKQEIALVHALEVGITELVARRERFKH